MPTVDLLDHQIDFCDSPAPYPAIVGGLGSGKTRAGQMRLLLLMLDDPGANTLYTMPTYDLLRLRAIPGFEEDLEALGLEYRLNKSEWSITIPSLGGSIFFRSYEKPERLVAFEVAHSIADELDTISRDKAALVWRKISERTRQESRVPNSIGVVTTPDQGVTGFIYEKWAKKRQPGYEIIKASTLANHFLPPAYVEQIRSNYDPILADLYLNGEFVSLSENKVYHFYDRKAHYTNRVLGKDDNRLHVSIDFNIGGCCAVVWLIEGNMPVAVDEFVSHDTYDFCNNLASRYPGKHVTVYPDASGRAGRTNAEQSDVAIIEQAGHTVDAPKANPAIRSRINAFNALLSHNQVRVNSDKCPELAFALESQGYNDKGEPEKFTSHPAIDDWADSAGYFIHQRFPVSKPATPFAVKWAT
jgi:hypothetical protein